MNTKYTLPVIALCAAMLAAGCERMAPPAGVFPQAAADGWVAAFNSGDAAGLALMYSPKSEILPPDGPVVSGHSAIEEFWKAGNPGTVRIELSGIETARLGDYWFRQGTYSAKDEGDDTPEFGKFIELWKKVDSAWLIYRQMWSPNAPPQAAAPAVPAG